jgi:hypothetical protein
VLVVKRKVIFKLSGKYPTTIPHPKWDETTKNEEITMKKFGFASVASALLTATIGFGVAAGVSGCTGANPAAYVCAEGKVWSNSLQDCVVKMPAGQTDGGNNNHNNQLPSY